MPGAPTPANVVAIPAFELDVEPVTNAEFVDFVRAHPAWRKLATSSAVRGRADICGAGAADLALADDRGGRRAGHQCLLVRRAGLLQGPRRAAADHGTMGIRARRRRSCARGGSVTLARLVRPAELRPPAANRRGTAQRFWPAGSSSGSSGSGRSTSTPIPSTAELRDPNGKDSALVCGGAAAGATDADRLSRLHALSPCAPVSRPTTPPTISAFVAREARHDPSHCICSRRRAGADRGAVRLRLAPERRASRTRLPETSLYNLDSKRG